MNSVLKITEPKPVCRKTTVQPVYFILLIYHICDIRLLNIITIFSLFDSLKLLQESGHHDLLLIESVGSTELGQDQESLFPQRKCAVLSY